MIYIITLCYIGLHNYLGENLFYFFIFINNFEKVLYNIQIFLPNIIKIRAHIKEFSERLH